MVRPEVGFDVSMMTIGFQEERKTFLAVVPWKTCFQLAAASGVVMIVRESGGGAQSVQQPLMD